MLVNSRGYYRLQLDTLIKCSENINRHCFTDYTTKHLHLTMPITGMQKNSAFLKVIQKDPVHKYSVLVI